MVLLECCVKKIVKTQNFISAFFNGNQQKEQLLDYIVCDFQVLLLKR